MRVLLPPLKQPQTSTDLVGFNLHNPTNADIRAQYITFMQTFRSGAVQASDNLTANGLPVQMDVKTTHSDGSVRSALITFKHPMLPANSMTQFMLVKSASTPTRSPPSFAGLNLKVQIGTSTYIINDTFVAASSSFWQRGPLVAQARVNIPVSGSLRLTVDVTAYDDNTYAADVQFNNDAAMQASGGTQNYTATISWKGTTVLSQAVTHYQYQTWHKVIGASPANVVLDIAYLISTGALPNLDLAAGVDSNSGFLKAPVNTGILGAGSVEKQMGMTGGRPDIGLMTGWNAAWLLTQHPAAAKFALAQADVCGSVPWHFFDAAKGGYISLNDYPTLWVDTRGTPTLKQPVKEPTWEPQNAHMPDLSYVPYLLTGRRYYLDQLNAQATYAVFSTAPDDTWGRKSGQGIVARGFGEVRDQAWALRMIVEAAWCNPTGSVEATYWQKVADANWTFVVGKMSTWQSAQGEGYGRMAGEYGNEGFFAPWQQDYFASVATLAVLMGSTIALTFLKWMSNFLIGRFVQKSGWNPRDGIAYNVAEGSTWAAMGSKTVSSGNSNGAGPGWPGSNGNFGEIALATLAGIIRVTDDANAKAAYAWLKAQNPPLTTPYFDEVQFGVVPAKRALLPTEAR